MYFRTKLYIIKEIESSVIINQVKSTTLLAYMDCKRTCAGQRKRACAR